MLKKLQGPTEILKHESKYQDNSSFSQIWDLPIDFFFIVYTTTDVLHFPQLSPPTQPSPHCLCQWAMHLDCR